MADGYWRVALAGSSEMLDYLSSISGKSWQVWKDGADYYLKTPDFESCGDSLCVLGAGQRLALTLQYVAWADQHLKGSVAVSAVSRVHTDRPATQYVHAGFIESTVMVFSPTVGGSKPPATFEEMTDRLRHDDAVTNSIVYFQRATGSWTANLRNTFETIRGDVRDHLQLKQGLALGTTGVGWVSDDEFERFWSAVHDRSVSGFDALHTEFRRAVPPDPMTQHEAEQFIDHLLQKWIRWKYSLLEADKT